jgi:hypothetical protein
MAKALHAVIHKNASVNEACELFNQMKKEKARG